MMEALQAAQEFLAKSYEMGRDALREAFKALPEEVQKLYSELRKASYFVPENEVHDSRKEILSPSGKYKLVISRFIIGPGSWDYSQGVVYRKDDDKPIATVQRNYGSFPFLFIEDHPKGDFLTVDRTINGKRS